MALWTNDVIITVCVRIYVCILDMLLFCFYINQVLIHIVIFLLIQEMTSFLMKKQTGEYL